MAINIQIDCSFNRDVAKNLSNKWDWILVGLDETQNIKITIENRDKFDTEKECNKDLDGFIFTNNLQII